MSINGQPVHSAEEVYKILQQDGHHNTIIEMEFQVKRDHGQDLTLKVRPQLIMDH